MLSLSGHKFHGPRGALIVQQQQQGFALNALKTEAYIAGQPPFPVPPSGRTPLWCPSCTPTMRSAPFSPWPRLAHCAGKRAYIAGQPPFPVAVQGGMGDGGQLFDEGVPQGGHIDIVFCHVGYGIVQRGGHAQDGGSVWKSLQRGERSYVIQ